MKTILLGTVLICSTLEYVLPARILVIVPFPGASHHMFTTAIMKALSEKGHQIVEFSPFPPKKPIANHTHIQLDISLEKAFNIITWRDFINRLDEYGDIFIRTNYKRNWDINYDMCEETFKNKEVQKLLKSNEKFDLFMTESTWGEESLLVFGHRFSVPTIDIDPFFPWTMMNRYAGNDLSIASVPDLTSFAHANNPMTFKERMSNFLSIAFTLTTHYFIHLPKHEDIIKKHVDLPDIPPLVDMVTNVSIYLTNSHPPSINYVIPYTPNIIPLAGINILPGSIVPDNPMSQEIKVFMDGAAHGVVYMSFGTIVPLHLLPKEELKIFLDVFKKLPQRVLWKIGLDKSQMPELPSNVMITKWAPQLSVLGHPNCRMFITHGGLFSLQETIYSGVPTLGMPFFADQQFNIQFTIHRGFGVKLEYNTLSVQTLYEATTTVLNNPKYKENAARLSKIYRDRAVSPADEAVYWVEYVLRHRGAPHLRPVSADMCWYQLALLDVIAAVVTATVVILILTWWLLKKTHFYLCHRNNGRKNISKNKKNK